LFGDAFVVRNKSLRGQSNIMLLVQHIIINHQKQNPRRHNLQQMFTTRIMLAKQIWTAAAKLIFRLQNILRKKKFFFN